MLIVAALVVILITLTVIQVRFYVRRRRVQRMSWDDHLARLQPVNLKVVEEIAESFLRPSHLQLRLEPTAMWERLGKSKGLKALNTNADTILDLAAFAARWDSDDGRVVAEMIRRDGVHLKRAVFKIKVMMPVRLYRDLAPFQLQEAAAAYHLMRGRLLGLCEVAPVDLYTRLVGSV